MTKIGVISDTHENMGMIAKAVGFFNSRSVDVVLHAGDIISPITIKEFKSLNCRIIAVFGNNDGEKKMLAENFTLVGEIHFPPHEMEIDGNCVLMMHEPDNLDTRINSGKYSIIIYGHTHKTDIRAVNNTTVVNPGECGAWITGKSTVAIIHLPGKRVELESLQ